MKYLYRILVVLLSPTTIIALSCIVIEMFIRILLTVLLAPFTYIFYGEFKGYCGKYDFFDDRFGDDYISKYILYPFGYFVNKVNEE